MSRYVCLQSQLKDAQLSAREATQTQAELASKIKELEKKVRNLEGDISQSQEVRGVGGVGVKGIMEFCI